jgi:hypothetical protein
VSFRERLSNLQIVIMRSLFKRGGTATPISLFAWQHRSTLDLWRRGLIEIWYKQAADANPSLRGPFYTLTIAGTRLAQSFFRTHKEKTT